MLPQPDSGVDAARYAHKTPATCTVQSNQYLHACALDGSRKLPSTLPRRLLLVMSEFEHDASNWVCPPLSECCRATYHTNDVPQQEYTYLWPPLTQRLVNADTVTDTVLINTVSLD